MKYRFWIFPKLILQLPFLSHSRMLLPHPVLHNVLVKSVTLLICYYMDIMTRGFLISDLLYGITMKVFKKNKIGRCIF